jgi:hypothetical protein
MLLSIACRALRKIQTMTHYISTLAIIFMMLIFVSCSTEETIKKGPEAPTDPQEFFESKKKEPHRYGGWYCPDNFGFAPVDIQRLNEVPAIAHRLPTQQELQDHKSLIAVDTKAYPDARALEMDLPRVGRIYSKGKGMSELVIVIQAIIVSGDTLVGYRFPNGGNGSAWLSEVSFLTEGEIAEMGSQPFFFSHSVLKASKEDIWRAITQTEYAKELGEKFDEKEFFSSEWTTHSQAHLDLDSDGEKATGYVGMVFGNAYLHIDYDRQGFHYSEKLLLIEKQEDNTTELFFASGPYPQDYAKQQSNWKRWLETVQQTSEAN